jgi:hypothetical protein
VARAAFLRRQRSAQIQYKNKTKIRARQEEERDATQSQQKQPKGAGRPDASAISGAQENGAVKGPPHVRGNSNGMTKQKQEEKN